MNRADAKLAEYSGGATAPRGVGDAPGRVNEETSRRVDLTQGESVGFLGFEVRRIRSRRGRWMPLHIPRGKKRTALLRTLKQILRSHRSRPVTEVIAQTNPIPRGWVQYFTVGHSSRCFSYIRNWVDKKIRHHLVRAGQRHGFGTEN